MVPIADMWLKRKPFIQKKPTVTNVTFFLIIHSSYYYEVLDKDDIAFMI